MANITAKIDVHGFDDVTFNVDTGEFLDAIGPVDQGVEDAVNEALDAYVAAYATFPSECWFSLWQERDRQKILRQALATALMIEPEEVSADYSFATCNWENPTTSAEPYGRFQTGGSFSPSSRAATAGCGRWWRCALSSARNLRT